MSAASARKPWPLRWIVATILLFIVPYTYVNLKFRKPGPAFEPYADMKDQANVKRLLDAGYIRVSLRAERPFPPLPAAQVASGPLALASPAPGGLPDPLRATLVEIPLLPTGYRDLVAPATLDAQAAARLQFTARLDDDHRQLGGAALYIREDTVVIVPTFETVPGALAARTREGNILLTLPPGLLAPGTHQFTLAGSRDSLRWSVLVR